MKDFIKENNFIYLPNALIYKNNLILGDLHLGFEENEIKKGNFIPKYNLKNILNKIDFLKNIINKYNFKINKIIINGDIKHSFTITNKETIYEIEKIITKLNEISKNQIYIKGNHDNFLPFESKDYFEEDDFFITHGDKYFKTNKKIIILSHEHPSIGLKLGNSFEEYKIFLKGKFEDKYYIILPSFTNVATGTNILQTNFLSKYLKKIYEKNKNFLKDWEIIIFEENELFKIKLKELI